MLLREPAGDNNSVIGLTDSLDGFGRITGAVQYITSAIATHSHDP